MASEAEGRTIGNRISGVQIRATPSLMPTKIAPTEAHFPELSNEVRSALERDVLKDVRSQMVCVSRSTIMRARRFFCPFPFLSIKWWASVLCFMIVLMACALLYLRLRDPKLEKVSPSSASHPSNWV